MKVRVPWGVDCSCFSIVNMATWRCLWSGKAAEQFRLFYYLSIYETI